MGDDFTAEFLRSEISGFEEAENGGIRLVMDETLMLQVLSKIIDKFKKKLLQEVTNPEGFLQTQFEQSILENILAIG